MNRYAGQVTTRQLLVGLAVVAAAVAGIVALTEVLVPEGETLPTLDAPAEDDAAAPGEIVCPEPEELPPSETPASVGAGLLIDCSQLFDGRLVAYEGEVVDVVLDRGDRAWVQLNDDPYSGEAGPLPEHRTALGGNSGIAVSIPQATAQRIDYVGSYHAQGDLIAVVGTFHEADPADAGAPAIQALEAEVARVGHPIEHPVSVARVVAAGLLSLIALAMAAVIWRQKRTGGRLGRATTSRPPMERQ